MIKVGDKFFTILYSYYSYIGFDIDDAEVYQVKPVERMVTFYEII